MQSGIFLERLNRFIAVVQRDNGDIVEAHLANTGRMKELLIPGTPCWLTPAENKKRKTAWNLQWILQRDRWVCLRAVYANDMMQHWLMNKTLPGFTQLTALKKEVRIGGSRFDFTFQLNDELWVVEVKSVNLVFADGLALFPDAPTSRGSRHIEELIRLQAEGYRTGLFLVVMGQYAERLRFNAHHDARFAARALAGRDSGMAVRAYRSRFDPPQMSYDGEIAVEWED